jgi:hypothetical protein
MGSCEMRPSGRSVLLVGYRRHQNLASLLDFCIEKDLSPIYVSLDGPATANERIDTDKCREVLMDFDSRYPKRISVKISNSNLGAAQSVIEAVSWAFQNEEFLVVLEDDCIPTDEFFDFVNLGRPYLEQAKDCYLICGTQFAPTSITSSTWALSSYPLIWGWATTRSKWEIILRLLQKFEKSRKFSGHGSLPERSFWHAGAKRSYLGFVDAWDLPLVHAMRHVGGLALLPGENLVSNIGNDGYATHTLTDSPWLNRPTGKIHDLVSEPALCSELDKWLRKNFYRIRFRHLLTNALTAMLDEIGFNKRKRAPLLERLFDS